LNRHVALCLAFATGLSLEVLAGPQAPIKDSPRPRYGAGPPPYTAVEVAFQNAVDNVQLAGTLTIPRGALNAPALKSFLAIADALSRNGSWCCGSTTEVPAGRWAKSSCRRYSNSLVTWSRVRRSSRRPEVNPKRIGIIGHSFAGLTAPIAAIRSNDVAFVITLAGLMTDARVNLERLPPGLRAVTTATWTTLTQSSPTLSSFELESGLREAFTLAMANVSDQERAPIQSAMAAIVTQWVKWAPLRRSQALTDSGEALRALTKPFLAIHGARDRDLDAATNSGRW
jgi:hypothetical protein